MKKNVMMRVASVLLVAVMLTTCVISGTFAKYVTDATSSDSARVAKWGVTVTGSSDMFDKEYKNSGSEVTVYSSTDKLVAPGTDGTLSSFTVTGTPEVDTSITYTPVVKVTGYWFDGAADFYCPIVVTVKSDATYTICGLDYDDNVAFENAIIAAIEKANKTCNTGDDLSTVSTDLSVSWEWAFDDVAHGALCAGTSHKVEQTDGKDTFLGDWEKKGNATPKISVSITCTITQVD